MYRYFRGHQTFFSQFLELELLDYIVDMDFPGGAASGKGSACQCKRHKRLEFKKKKKKRDSSSIPGSGRSPGGGHGNPLLPRKSCGQGSLENYNP